MENKLNTSLKSEIFSLQNTYLSIRLAHEIEEAETREEVDSIVNKYVREYFMKLGSPIMIKRYPEEDHPAYIEDYNQTMEEISVDTSIIFEEIGIIAESLHNYFNYAQTEKNRIRNRIHKVANYANDLNLIANEKSDNSVYWKDSFNDYTKIESRMIMGTPADVSTQEGVITLRKSGVTNRSNAASIRNIQGDGMNGTSHLVKRTSDSPDVLATYISDSTPNNDPSVILDGQPDTIFEYQTVNVDRDLIVGTAKGYDFNWVSGKRYGDKLRLHLVIELEEAQDVNWININPYHPPGSTGKVVVHSIRTSEDGFEYKPLFQGRSYVLNSELNMNSQTYREDELFTGDNSPQNSKFAGQGVWSFPIRKAKYVEVVLDQDESYAELIGHTYYERVTSKVNPENGQVIETCLRVPSSEVSDKIIKGPFGRYPLGKEEYIDKKLEVFEGWRYAIGLRDINIMSHEYEKKSEIISTKFEVDRPIKQLMLYSNEKVPEDFLREVAKSNDWIKYYITYDDVNWYPISPMHHQPMNSEFPPKIYEFNPSTIELESSLKLYKEYVETENPPMWARVKIVIERPDVEEMKYLTPIVEDYSLRFILEEQN